MFFFTNIAEFSPIGYNLIVERNKISKNTPESLQQIILRAQSSISFDPKALYTSKPFTSESYGEISYELVNSIISQLGDMKDKVVVDLGSGLGNVVIQIAGMNFVIKKCIGIELSKPRWQHSVAIAKQFRHFMKSFDMNYSAFELLEGDFTKASPILETANIFFVNNFAFKPELDNQLLDIFSRCKDGTQIVTSKELYFSNFWKIRLIIIE